MNTRAGVEKSADRPSEKRSGSSSDEPVPRRAVAAALGAFGLLALGCAAPAGATSSDEKRTRRTSQALLTGATAAGSIYELRTAGIAWDQAVYLQGYYVPGDGGEGNFYCDVADTTSVDNGGTVIVDVLDQRWKRETNGLPFSVKWFGAYGDGATDDLAAIQATISGAQTSPTIGRATVCFPPGVYRISSTLVITSNIRLIGSGNHIAECSRIVPDTRSYNVIEVQGTNYGFDISDMIIGPPLEDSGTGGVGIKLLQAQYANIEKVDFSNLWSGILVDSSGDINIRRVKIAPALTEISVVPRFGIKCTGYTQFVAALGGNSNATTCSDVLVEDPTRVLENNVRVPSQQVDAFVLAVGYNTLVLQNCGALNTKSGRLMTAEGSAYYPDILVDQGGACDHCFDAWLLLDGGTLATYPPKISCVQLNNCFCTSSDGENYYIGNSFVGTVQFTGCIVRTSGKTHVAGEGAGFRLAGAGNYVLTGCIADGTGGHNVSLSNFTGYASIVGGALMFPGSPAHIVTGPDHDSIRLYGTAAGALSLAGIVQHNADRGLYRSSGSTTVIHGQGEFLVNFTTAVNYAATTSSPASNVWYP